MRDLMIISNLKNVDDSKIDFVLCYLLEYSKALDWINNALLCCIAGLLITGIFWSLEARSLSSIKLIVIIIATFLAIWLCCLCIAEYILQNSVSVCENFTLLN